ncbi:hypothetical protein EVAR_21194_1 [Eumeta japonica]|uniref:Uncharacterized protein n=1 Tax=Eumeta variegata TaxID=151549 RepID=A0A4C1UQF5_EUMVA|nr:hypothetical protein EVAR_21194_1 [Eumeta japonica]
MCAGVFAVTHRDPNVRTPHLNDLTPVARRSPPKYWLRLDALGCLLIQRIISYALFRDDCDWKTKINVCGYASTCKYISNCLYLKIPIHDNKLDNNLFGWSGEFGRSIIGKSFAQVRDTPSMGIRTAPDPSPSQSG